MIPRYKSGMNKGWHNYDANQSARHSRARTTGSAGNVYRNGIRAADKQFVKSNNYLSPRYFQQKAVVVTKVTSKDVLTKEDVDKAQQLQRQIDIQKQLADLAARQEQAGEIKKTGEKFESESEFLKQQKKIAETQQKTLERIEKSQAKAEAEAPLKAALQARMANIQRGSKQDIISKSEAQSTLGADETAAYLKVLENAVRQGTLSRNDIKKAGFTTKEVPIQPGEFGYGAARGREEAVAAVQEGVTAVATRVAERPFQSAAERAKSIQAEREALAQKRALQRTQEREAAEVLGTGGVDKVGIFNSEGPFKAIGGIQNPLIGGGRKEERITQYPVATEAEHAIEDLWTSRTKLFDVPVMENYAKGEKSYKFGDMKGLREAISDLEADKLKLKDHWILVDSQTRTLVMDPQNKNDLLHEKYAGGECAGNIVLSGGFNLSKNAPAEKQIDQIRKSTEMLSGIKKKMDVVDDSLFNLRQKENRLRANYVAPVEPLPRKVIGFEPEVQKESMATQLVKENFVLSAKNPTIGTLPEKKGKSEFAKLAEKNFALNAKNPLI